MTSTGIVHDRPRLFDRIRIDAVGDDVHRTAFHEPGVAIDARAFIPPAFHRVGVHAHGNRVHGVAVLRHRRDVDVERRVAAPVACQDRAVEPHGAVRGHAVELQFEVLAAVGGIQLELGADTSRCRATDSLGDCLPAGRTAVPPPSRAADQPAANRNRCSPARLRRAPGRPWRCSRNRRGFSAPASGCRRDESASLDPGKVAREKCPQPPPALSGKSRQKSPPKGQTLRLGVLSST